VNRVSRTFVQVGATRDGLDPYLDSARKRTMTAVLVETPAYLAWRRQAGRRPFDTEVAVDRPQQPGQVVTALRGAGLAPAMVLTGFERYATSGFGVAAALRVPPQPVTGEPFVPPDKIRQRTAVSANAPHVLQPRYSTDLSSGLAGLGGPLVVKPTDGGGGLGVFRVPGPEQLESACALIAATSNYGGGAFSGVLAEEQVQGVEYSVQGVAWRGRVTLLGVCEKGVATDPAPAGLRGFREVAHIFVLGAPGVPDFTALVQDCLDAVGYHDGPFHLDLILGDAGPVLVEMGFRLSGGALAGLISKATGQQWADWVFACHLGERPPRVPRAAPQPVGQATARSEAELQAAEQAQREGHQVEILRFAVPRGDDREAAGPPELASDRIRHWGAVGRIEVTAGHVQSVRDLLRRFLGARQEV